MLRQPAAVKNVYAEAYSGGAWLGIEFTLNADIDKAMQQAQTSIDQFTWPSSVSTPNLVQEQLIEPLGWVFVSQAGDVNSLRSIAEQAKQQLTAAGIAQVEVQGLPETDLHWKPSMQTWLALQQAPTAIKQQMLADNQLYSIGSFRGQSLQAGSDAINSQQIGSLMINNTPIGLLHPIKDLSQGQVNFRIDGQPAALIALNRASGMGTVEAGDIVKQWIEEFGQQYPNVYINSFMDPVNLLEGHLDLLIDNALLGLVLVLLTLFVLLNSRVAFWTAAGIPIAIIATFALLYLFADSINLFSIFALLIALGIVVDDAIVVSEQTLTYYQRGYSAQQAAILGAKRMLSPVLAAALTSIAAFRHCFFYPAPLEKCCSLYP